MHHFAVTLISALFLQMIVIILVQLIAYFSGISGKSTVHVTQLSLTLKKKIVSYNYTNYLKIQEAVNKKCHRCYKSKTIRKPFF